MGEQARQMAGAVLVNGMTTTEAGKMFGVTRQRIGLAVAVIQRVYDSEVAPSSNAQINVSMDLPEVVALALGRFVTAHQDCVDGALQKEAVEQLEKAIDAATKRLKLAIRAQREGT